jgi:hypothetical protein
MSINIIQNFEKPVGLDPIGLLWLKYGKTSHITRIIRWLGHVVRMTEINKAFEVLIGKPEGKRLIGRFLPHVGDVKYIVIYIYMYCGMY